MKILNRKAGFDYLLSDERLEAGLSLKGIEAKSLREGRGDISQSFVKIIDNEIYLINANIPVPDSQTSDPTRSRKLLLHGSEIVSLLTKSKQQKLAIVPLKLYNKGRLIKIELALGKPKRNFEKKESIKRKDIERDMAQEYKNSV